MQRAVLAAAALAPAFGLAAPKRRCHFINLTNGLEALPVVGDADVNFVRIQSSKCEANDFYGLLADLDHNLLFRLATGHECVILDYGSRGSSWKGEADGTKIPRAIWWGLEWIRYALQRKWRVDAAGAAPPTLRGYNVERLFDEKLARLPKAVSKKLRYYRKFGPAAVDLVGAYRPGGTPLDGRDDAYARFASDWVAGRGADGGGGDDGDDARAAPPPGFRFYRAADYAGVGRGACARTPPPPGGT